MESFLDPAYVLHSWEKQTENLRGDARLASASLAPPLARLVFIGCITKGDETFFELESHAAPTQTSLMGYIVVVVLIRLNSRTQADLPSLPPEYRRSR